MEPGEPKVEKTRGEVLKEISDELFSLSLRINEAGRDKIDEELRVALNIAFNNIRQRLGKFYNE